MSRAITVVAFATCLVGVLAIWVLGGEQGASASAPEAAMIPAVGQNVPRLAREAGAQPGKAKAVAGKEAERLAADEATLAETQGGPPPEGPITELTAGPATPTPVAAETPTPAVTGTPTVQPTPRPTPTPDVQTTEWRRRLAEARRDGTLHLLLANEASFRQALKANAIDYKPLHQRERQTEGNNEALWRVSEKGRPKVGYPYAP